MLFKYHTYTKFRQKLSDYSKYLSKRSFILLHIAALTTEHIKPGSRNLDTNVTRISHNELSRDVSHGFN